MDGLDFSRSFCTWRLKEQASQGRFAIESVLIDPVRGERFFLLSGVMAANVYGVGRLILDPPYEFMAVFGPETYRVFRTHTPLEPSQDSLMRIDERFQSVALHLPMTSAEPLDTMDALIHATLEPHPLIAHMVLASGLQLVFPVKHINVQPETRQFQVETGPILIPDDLTTPRLEQLFPAYIVFNRLDQAEILLRQPCQIGNALIRAYDGWQTFSAHIQIMALPG